MLNHAEVSQEPIDILLSRLPAYTRAGPSSFKACCPAHDDRSPSLSITRLHDGRVLIHCFGGCGGADVLDAIGMSYGDLYPGGGYYKPQQSKEMTHDEWVLWIAEQDVKSGKKVDEKTKRQILQAKIKAMRAGHGR